MPELIAKTHDRPNAGPVQFDGEPPGVYISGGIALSFSCAISELIKKLEGVAKALEVSTEVKPNEFSRIAQCLNTARHVRSALQSCDHEYSPDDARPILQLASWAECAQDPQTHVVQVGPIARKVLSAVVHCGLGELMTATGDNNSIKNALVELEAHDLISKHCHGGERAVVRFSYGMTDRGLEVFKRLIMTDRGIEVLEHLITNEEDDKGD